MYIFPNLTNVLLLKGGIKTMLIFFKLVRMRARYDCSLSIASDNGLSACGCFILFRYTWDLSKHNITWPEAVPHSLWTPHVPKVLKRHCATCSRNVPSLFTDRKRCLDVIRFVPVRFSAKWSGGPFGEKILIPDLDEANAWRLWSS